MNFANITSAVARAAPPASPPEEPRGGLADGAANTLIAVEPSDEAQIQEVIRICAAGGVRVTPRGGGGHPLLASARDARPQVIVSTARLGRIVDYPDRDWVITVQAGMTLAELRAVTASRGEQLALDPPWPARATVGGLIATNACGPRQLRHGPVSHHLLAATMILADGRCVRAGARTVKNVAGYDAHKMFIGSFGSLGIVTQATLRLKPLAPCFRLLEIRLGTPARAAEVIAEIRRGPTRPAMMTLLNAGAAGHVARECPRGGLVLILGYEDDRQAVEWQLARAAAAPGQVSCLDEAASGELYQLLVDWPARTADFAFEVLLPHLECVPLLMALGERAVACAAQAGSGVVQACGSGAGSTADLAAALQCCAGGSIKFQRLPAAGHGLTQWDGLRHLAPSGARAPRRWMRRIKQHLDPDSVFPVPGFLGDGD